MWQHTQNRNAQNACKFINRTAKCYTEIAHRQYTEIDTTVTCDYLAQCNHRTRLGCTAPTTPDALPWEPERKGQKRENDGDKEREKHAHTGEHSYGNRRRARSQSQRLVATTPAPPVGFCTQLIKQESWAIKSPNVENVDSDPNASSTFLQRSWDILELRFLCE